MTHVEMSGLLAGILSIVAGVIVIVWPRVLAYIIGIYLIVIGVIAIVAATR